MSHPSHPITDEEFLKATGFPPEQDDLERSNCEHAGEMGHLMCGWDHSQNLPVFMASTSC